MENPFDVINVRLANIEKLLIQLLDEKIGIPKNDNPLNIEQAAAFLDRPVSTLYLLAGKREIPHSKKGKRLYFSKANLNDWIESGNVKTKKEIIQDADNILIKKAAYTPANR